MCDRKQRLWIITELFPPEETSTAYIMGEIANVFSLKYEVGVICGPEIYDKSRKQSICSKVYPVDNIYRAKVRTLNKNSFIGKVCSLILTTIALYRLAKKHVQSGDKVLIVTNPAPLIVLVSHLKSRRNFELNVLVHDVFPENTKAAGLSIPLYGVIQRLFNWAYAQASLIIVLGRDMYDLISKKTNGQVPVEVIENWGDFENIYPIQMPDTEKIIVGYAGNIGRVQGLDKIIQELPNNIELHIYGSGAMEVTLKSMNHPNVIFHGPYTREEQSEILGACHISLVTLNEKMFGLGTPSKTYNILAAGRPILYFGPRNSEVELMIKEYNIGYCGWPKVWDIEDLRNKGELARVVGEKLYSKSSILNKFVNII